LLLVSNDSGTHFIPPTRPRNNTLTNRFLGLSLLEMSISTWPQSCLSNGGVSLSRSIQWSEEISDGWRSGVGECGDNCRKTEKTYLNRKVQRRSRGRRRKQPCQSPKSQDSSLPHLARNSPNGLRIINNLFPKLVVISLSSNLPTNPNSFSARSTPISSQVSLSAV
jgi:hypothetical protein